MSSAVIVFIVKANLSHTRHKHGGLTVSNLMAMERLIKGLEP